MSKQYYKILSQGSSHRGELGYFVSGFQYAGELHYTLKLEKEGFRSYPLRNLEKTKHSDEKTIEKLGKLFIKFLKKEFKI